MNTPISRTPLVAALIAMSICMAPAVEQKKPDEATTKIFQRAKELREGKQYEEAETLLTKAIAAGNDHIVLHMALALNYAVQKDFKKASESYQTVWTRTGEVNMLDRYAVSLVQLQDLERLRAIKGDLIGNFDKLKEGRLAALMIAAADGDRDLFDQAILKITVEEIRQDQQLASIIAQTAKKLAQDRMAGEGKQIQRAAEQGGGGQPATRPESN